MHHGSIVYAGVVVAPLGVVVTGLVQDTQERLIYRAQTFIRVRVLFQCTPLLRTTVHRAVVSK